MVAARVRLQPEPPTTKTPENTWQQKLSQTRSGVARALHAIEQGTIDEHEFDALNNFLMFALSLMEIAGPQKWEQAKVRAQLMSLSYKQDEHK